MVALIQSRGLELRYQNF